ncbi:hypothetical protein [Clostridium gasigenes]|uniref:hypothetical protein n=1 Tax=Clostridium gasigenes TaxID=94869 RepID=UPI001C0BE07F|nr:hypothetical protein [Clostridium gasigenes]MBU3102917.1 hypothetical protein [Clostridium gasigenes]
MLNNESAIKELKITCGLYIENTEEITIKMYYRGCIFGILSIVDNEDLTRRFLDNADKFIKEFI